MPHVFMSHSLSPRLDIRMAPFKVFISSVISGFEAERQAVRTAVESLRLEPIMAERDFGAKPYSSQEACLDGVRQSDVYVGIFGPRYGYVAASGKSATEEEFIEARAQGKPILCFVMRGEKESQQQVFLDHIGGYEEGYFFEPFESAEALTHLAVRSLNDLVNQPGISTLDLEGIVGHLDRHTWGSPRQPANGTWLGAVIFPLRQGETYLSSLTLDDVGVQDHLLLPARFGKSRLLDQELGATTQVHSKSLSFEQRDEHRQLTASLEVHTNGTIVCSTALGRVRTNPLNSSWLRNIVIEEPDVQARLSRFIEYARVVYDNLEQSSFVNSLGIGVSLSGLERKGFGFPLASGTSSITMPARLPSDPVRVPADGLKLARAQLGNPLGLSEQLTRYLSLEFRDAHAYYEKPE